MGDVDVENPSMKADETPADENDVREMRADEQVRSGPYDFTIQGGYGT